MGDEFFSEFERELNNPQKRERAISAVRALPPSVKENVLKGLKLNFDELSRRLPQQLDSETMLLSVLVSQYGVTYDHQLSLKIINQMSDQEATFKESIYDYSKNRVCSEPRQFFFLLLGINYIFQYHGADGKMYYSYRITENSCV